MRDSIIGSPDTPGRSGRFSFDSTARYGRESNDSGRYRGVFNLTPGSAPPPPLPNSPPPRLEEDNEAFVGERPTPLQPPLSPPRRVSPPPVRSPPPFLSPPPLPQHCTQQTHSPAEKLPQGRDSYVEEPASKENTLNTATHNKKKEKKGYSRAGSNCSTEELVRQFHYDMQVAQYIQKLEINEEGTHASKTNHYNTNDVHRIRSLRFSEYVFRRLFWHMGKAIASHKIVFLMLPLLIFTATLAVPIFLKHKFSFELPFSSLLPTTDSSLNFFSSERSSSYRTPPPFNESNPTFDALDRFTPTAYSVILRTLDGKDTILQKKNVQLYSSLKRRIEGFDPSPQSWESICRFSCRGEKDLVERIIAKSHQLSLTYPETFVATSRESTNLTKLYLSNAIGGVHTDMDGAITRARSLQLTFRLKENTAEETLRKWRINFNHQVETEAALQSSLIIDRWSFSDFSFAVLSSIKETHKWLVVCGCVLFLFCVLSSFGPNSYQSKPMVGLQMGLVLMAALVGGLFIQMTGEGQIHAFVFPVFFILIGIGICWCHSLHCAWGKFSAAACAPSEKLAFILSHDGPGIALSAIAVSLSFLTAAAFCRIPLMQASFVILSASVALLAIFSLIYVSIFIYLAGRREAKGIKWFQLFKSGDTHFPAPNMAGFDSFALFALHDRLIDSRPSLARSISSMLINRNMRVLIVLFCTLYLIIAAWGCFNIQVELKEEDFVPSSSISRRYLDSFHHLFGRTNEYLEIDFHQTLDYFDPLVKNSIKELLEWPQTEQYATRSVSWLSEFARFEKASIYDITHDTFVPVINLVFLTTDSYRRFASDIIFDRFQTQIVRSRMYLELSQKGIAKRLELLEHLYSVARENGLPITIRAPFIFSLQHDLNTLSASLTAFGIALASLLALSLFLFAQPALTLLLLLTSASVLLETVGYSRLWGVPCNVITFTVAICANALTSVIVMSFCYHYSVSGRSTLSSSQRIQYTFQSCLASVTFACFVPCITYVPLLTINTPIISQLFKVLLVNSIACFIHFLLFLPNLLLLITEKASRFWRLFSCEMCCVEEEGSIYYIPTAPRPIIPAVYQPGEYAYTLPKSIAPPGYLAIGAPDRYGMKPGTKRRETRDREAEGRRRKRRNRAHSISESSIAASESGAGRRSGEELDRREGRQGRREGTQSSSANKRTSSRDDSLQDGAQPQLSAPPSFHRSLYTGAPSYSASAAGVPTYPSSGRGPSNQWRPYVMEEVPMGPAALATAYSMYYQPRMAEVASTGVFAARK